MYLQDVEERHREGKFGGGAVLFYLQSSIVYFCLALICSIPLWLICEGEDVPIEVSNMIFNQTNTTVVGNCDDFAENAKVLYTSSALLMVFMFGVLVPNQITKADALKKAVLDHYDSIYILRRVGYIASAYGKVSIPENQDNPITINKMMNAYTQIVMSSMNLATIVSRRQFMTHEIVDWLRRLQDMWSSCNRKTEVEIKQRDEDENAIIEWQLDALSAIFVEIHRLANNNSNPASHGVPLNGSTPLSCVLELTAVGQSTFDTRYLLLFFAALTAVCGSVQELSDNREIDMFTAWTYIMSNYVMIVIPYCLLGPFVFRKDIFKERSPYEESDESKREYQDRLASANNDKEREEIESGRPDELQKIGLERNGALDTQNLTQQAKRLRILETNNLKSNNRRLGRSSTALSFSPFTGHRNSFGL